MAAATTSIRERDRRHDATTSRRSSALARAGEPVAPWRRGGPIASFLRSRIVQFLFFGAIVFAITKRTRDDRVIDLSRHDLDVALQAEAQKHPTAATTTSDVDERAIEDELLYREGLRLGLDREDGIVRQRVIQKMLYYAEELGGATQPPTDAELRAYYEATRSHWLRATTYAFEQVFAKDRAALEAMRAKIAVGADPKPVGEASPIGFEVRLSKDRIADTLGSSFAAALPTAPTTTFGDPIASTYGWHSVRVLSVDAEAVAPFDEVKARVREEYLVARRQEAIAKYVETLFGQYRVRIDGVAIDRITPSRRLALRTESSGED